MNEALENLKAVLCDPEGKVSINGSGVDCMIIADSLDRLERVRRQLAYISLPKGTAGLMAERENGQRLAFDLVEHLAAIGNAASAEIPIVKNGKEYVVMVTEKMAGMYGGTPRVKIGKFIVCRQSEKTIWIEEDGVDGGEFIEEVFEQAVQEFYHKNF